MTQPGAGSPDLAAPGAKAQPGLVGLVVTHNRLDQLRVTVARLLADAIDAVLVVNNASTDGTAEFLASVTDPRLHVLSLSVNHGGSGGFERGLRAATARFDPDWCVLMDDDARPEPGVLARFRNEAIPLQSQGHEAVAAGVYYPDGDICEMNRPSRNPFWNLRSFLRTLFGGGRKGFHISDAEYTLTTPRKVDNASFVGLFLSRAAIRRAGYPNGKLFIYADDVLYTLKLTRAGGSIAFAPWLRFEHDCTTIVQGGLHIHRPLWKVYYTYRNGLLAYRAAAGPLWFWLVLLLVVPKWALKSRHYGPDRALYLKLLGLAVRDALTGKLERSHHNVRRLARHVVHPKGAATDGEQP